MATEQRTLGFGVDIGGTGIKAAPVDLTTGELTGRRRRITTPHPATPERVAAVVSQLVAAHGWRGPLGICMPSVVTNGVIRSAANIDDAWIAVDGDRVFSDVVGHPVHVLNDADAAGIAEMTWGAGKGRPGVVICLTFGTGIGSGLFVDGVLVPNTELGHVELDGVDAERRAAASARKREGIGWREWAERADRYLRHIVMLFSPDLIIVGGGVSKQPHKWIDRVDPGCELVVARLANNAGIVGAALVAPE